MKVRARLTCFTCGNYFKAVRVTAMHCSARCRQQWSRAQRAAGGGAGSNGRPPRKQ